MIRTAGLGRGFLHHNLRKKTSQIFSSRLYSSEISKKHLTNEEVSADDAFDVRKDLENLHILSLSQIVARTSTELEKKYLEPNKKFKERLKNEFGKSLYLVKGITGNPKYLFDPVSLGDVIQASNIDNYDSSLTGELGVIIKEPIFANDDHQLTVLGQNGSIYKTTKQNILFRIPGVFERKFIKDVLVTEKLKDTEINKTERTVKDPGELVNGDDSVEISEAGRLLVLKKLKDITSNAWTLLPSMLYKLEVVHRILQVGGIQSISIFDLATIARSFNIKDFQEQLKKNIEKVSGKSLKNKINNKESLIDAVESRLNSYEDVERLIEFVSNFRISKNQYSLGINYAENSKGNNKSVDERGLFAIYLALQKQTDLWNLVSDTINSQIRSPMMIQVKSALTPLLTLSEREWQMYADSIIDYINSSLKGTRNINIQPRYYDEVIQLIREYAAGNINDNEHISVVLYLLRKLDLFSNINKLDRTCAFHLLKKMGELPEDPENFLIYQNPNNWTKTINIPELKFNEDKISMLEQDYYDSLTEKDLKDPKTKQFADPLLGKRRDFGDLPVYCIDSETAHEIDDGVSIMRESSSKWIIAIHIADPASYFDPDSSIAKIALKRASTIYLPETTVPMLPKLLSDISGLGIDGKDTRTITYTVEFNPITNQVDYETGAIVGGIVKKFPKVTYNKVDEILKDPSHVYYRDLNDLLHVSEILRKERSGKGLIMRSDKMVPVIDKTTHAIDLEIQKETESTILVSELMVLANSIAGNVFEGNRIPGIFRNLQKMIGYYASLENKLSKNKKPKNYCPEMVYIYDAYKGLQKRYQATGVPISFEEISRLIQLWNTSFYSMKPSGHSFLGIQNYNPSTSPLRRFGDLVSHWHTHQYLTKEHDYPFNFNILAGIIPHIQQQNQYIKRVQRISESYWKIILLLQNLNGEGTDILDSLVNINYQSENNKFKFEVRYYDTIMDEYVYGTIEEYKLSAKLKIGINEIKPEIGETVPVKVHQLSAVENEIIVTRNGS